MAGYFSKEQLEDYKECFRLFDTDGNGNLDKNEISTVMRSLGPKPTEIQLRDMIKTVDKDGNGTLDFDEFLDLMKVMHERGIGGEDEILEAFKTFDSDGSGSIAVGELKKVLTELGDTLTNAEVDEFMKLADKNGDGVLSYQEFATFLSQ